jgi:hypothetical protein
MADTYGNSGLRVSGIRVLAGLFLGHRIGRGAPRAHVFVTRVVSAGDAGGVAYCVGRDDAAR